MTERNKEYWNRIRCEYMRKKRHEWKASGMCHACGKHKTKSKSLCEACLQKTNIRSSAEKVRRKKDKVCLDCNTRISNGKTRCPSCLAKDAEKSRWNARLRLYGITRQEYDLVFESQRGLCKICGTELNRTQKGGRIDHNHSTGEVRGILCNHCNVGLHYIEDNVWAAKASEYLNSSTFFN